MVHKSDDLLITEYLNGNNLAFKELFLRYREPLFSYLVVLSHSQSEAEDLFQDIFIKVIDKLPSYRKENKFKQWLFTIAKNTYLDRLKSKSYNNKVLEISLDDKDDDEIPLHERIVSFEDTSKILDKIDNLRKVKYAINKISPEQKEVILLRHYAQLSFKEISEKLNLPIGTVLARFSRGIEKLREILSEMQ